MLKILIGTISVVVAIATSGASAAEFVLTSPAFKDATPLPVKFANNNRNNPNCVGENVSPPLQWSGMPEGTKSLALLMFDPEGQGGTGSSHFVFYGIEPSTTGFAEGELNKPSEKLVAGKGTAGQSVYVGPCAPAGPYHHYVLTLIATDLEPKALAAGMTRDELFVHIKGHSKGATGLVGLYSKPR